MSLRVDLQLFIPADILQTFAVLERRSVPLAQRFAKSVVDTLDWLAANPTAGSPEEFGHAQLTGFRSWHVRGFDRHLILYRVQPERIEVFAIVHGAQDLEALLLQRV
jgi:plasmid stabilization system protein ParE